VIEAGRCDIVMFPVGPFVDARYIDEMLPLAQTQGGRNGLLQDLRGRQTGRRYERLQSTAPAPTAREDLLWWKQRQDGNPAAAGAPPSVSTIP
jgi:hypothetical protein